MGLSQNIRRVTLGDLSPPVAPVVGRGATVAEAVRAMNEAGSGAVAVVDEGGRTVGMFSEKLLIRALVRKADALADAVTEHMTGEPVCLRAEDPVARLIRTMQHHQLRWVCIVDEDHRPVAMTGLRGVVTYVADYFAGCVRVQPMQTKISMQDREGA